MPEERKFASVLFADIVGSTAFGEAHDPEIVRAALAETFAGWRQILTAHGGTVEKFIGDAVMAVFGVPAAHEDDPERAVRAAFALRERVRAEQGTAPFDIRIGIASGEVVTGGGEDGGQFLVTGPSVNLAARLQHAASPGEILVDPLTRKLSHHAVAFDDGRAIDAKGIGQVEACPARELTRARPSARPTDRELRSPLVGRERELETLSSIYERARAERRAGLITIFGPAGIGKSRLLEEWIAAGRHHALVGRCLPYGEGVTFWPVREMLLTDASVNAADGCDDVAAKVRAAVDRAFTGDAQQSDMEAITRRLMVLVGTMGAQEALPEVPSANVGEELRWAVRRYLERRSQEGLVILFEDVQWAEPGLLDLIEHLAEWARGSLLIVCLARPELLDLRPRWSAESPGATALTLLPLSDDTIHALIAGLLGGRPPEALALEVCSRASGVPLYVEELVRTMIETSRVSRAGDAWVVAPGAAPMGAPPTLQGLIAARLDRYPAELKRAAQRAAVIGKRFSNEALSAVADERVDQGTLAEGERRALFHELDERGIGGGREYEFHHSLAREVAYGSVPKGERLRLHERFGLWLEGAAGDRVAEYGDTIAHHAEAAFLLARDLRSPRQAELGRRAFDLLLAAGARARRRSDLTAASSLYSRASKIAEAIDLVSAERVDAEGFAALVGYYVEGTTEAVARLDRAIETTRSAGPSEVLVRLLIQRGFIARDGERADGFFDEGLAAARATGDATLVAHAMTYSNAQAWARGDLVAHEVLLREAYQFMTANSVRADLGICLVWLATNALQRGDFSGAQRYLAEASREAEASGSKYQQWAVRRLGARVALAQGEVTDALRLAGEAVALGREVGARRLIGLAYVRLGDALAEAGRAADAVATLGEALQLVDRDTMREAYIEVSWKLARAALAAGDREAAAGHARAAREIAADAYSRSTAAAALAAVRDAEGDDGGAEDLYREALAAIASTGFQQLRADIQRELARHYVRVGRDADAAPLIDALIDFYRDPLAVKRRDEAAAMLRGAEAMPAV